MKIKWILPVFAVTILTIFVMGNFVVHAAPSIVDFELEIELNDNSKYDIEYEKKMEGFEAKYQVPGTATLYGPVAKNKVDSFINKLNISPNSNKTTLKNQIFSHFKIDKNKVTDFDLEVKFMNGKKLKIGD